MTFTQNSFFGNVLRYQVTFLPKTKMVRVVHMNILYRMDLEIYDSKSEFWREADNLDFQKKLKFKFWDPILTFEAISKTEMISKYILA